MNIISHFTEISLEIRDKEALLAALTEMGYDGKVEVHDAPVVLIGYDGNPRVLRHDNVRAEIVIRRQHLWRAANDIGFARQADGTYTAYISEYDREVQPTWHTRLLQAHGIHVAQEQLRTLGCVGVELTRQEDGTVVISGVRYDDQAVSSFHV